MKWQTNWAVKLVFKAFYRRLKCFALQHCKPRASIRFLMPCSKTIKVCIVFFFSQYSRMTQYCLNGDVGMTAAWGGWKNKSLREQVMKGEVNAEKRELQTRGWQFRVSHWQRLRRHTTPCCDTDRPSRRQHITGCPALERWAATMTHCLMTERESLLLARLFG